MDYGYSITDAGRYLIARLLAGDKLVLTRVMVGSGRIPDDVRMAGVKKLYAPVAPATTGNVYADGGVAKMTVEYRSDLNGGLEKGFWLREFGIFADDPSEGEILLLYATLGDFPQYVAPYKKGGGIDVRRFPISIAIGEDRAILADFNASLFMTAEDVKNLYETEISVDIERQIREGIEAHDTSPDAHSGFLKSLNIGVLPRLALAELAEEMDSLVGSVGYRYEKIVTFDTVEGITMTGNWNTSLARVEF